MLMVEYVSTDVQKEFYQGYILSLIDYGQRSGGLLPHQTSTEYLNSKNVQHEQYTEQKKVKEIPENHAT